MPGAAYPTIQFLGAAGTVTGSKYLIDTGTHKILVDAGMFQGEKELRERNFDPLPIPASEIDAVVLTHGHLDHVGYLPKLVRDGFKGPVYSTYWTGKIAEVILMDSAHLQEMEADRINNPRNGRKVENPDPRKPLYTKVDAANAILRLRDVPLETDFDIVPGVTGKLHNAGHILGSASIEMTLADGKKLVFSGDLGKEGHPILLPPVGAPAADATLVESTYGHGEHESEKEALARFASTVKTTISRGGTVIIPAFAVDRTEVVLRQIGNLMKNGQLPKVPVYVDGRMALSVLDLYRQAITAGDEEIRPDIKGTDPFNPVGVLNEVRTRGDRRNLARQNGVIIVASSGMASGGPVVGHLSARLNDRRNTVILVGYQAVETPGRALSTGAKQVTLDGRELAVRAEIEQVSFSGHADGNQLLKWLGRSTRGVIYPVHGEPEQSTGLKRLIERVLHRQVHVPAYRETVEVGAPQHEVALSA